MPALSQRDHIELLMRMLKRPLQPEGWPPVLNFIDGKLNCRTFLAEYDGDGTPLRSLGGEDQARELATLFSRIETVSGNSAFEFLLTEASPLYPYSKTSLANHRQTTSAPATGSQETSHGDANMADNWLKNAPGLVTPVRRTAHSSVLFGCLFRGYSTERIDADRASATFHIVVSALLPALDLHFQLEKQRLENQLQELMLLEQESAAVLVDANRVILAETSEGLERLNELDIAVRRQRQLAINSRRLEIALQEHLATYEDGGIADPTSVLFCPAPESGLVCRVSLETVSCPGLPPDACAQPLFLIRTTTSKDPPEEVEICLQDHYELSHSEARLAWHLTMTGALSTTIQDLGITQNTAKTHLRRIYEKTGAHTQLQLARLVHRIARLF